MKEDKERLIGDVRIIFALKKHEAINDYVIKNRSLSRVFAQNKFRTASSQSCGGKKCGTCNICCQM